MIISHKINLHLDRMDETVLEAVQGDTGRELLVTLHHQGTLWTAPEGTKVQVRFRKADGTGGCYDTLPDGSAAYTISGSTLTVRLAPQVLTAAGITQVQVVLLEGGNVVGTFAVLVRVQADPSLDAMESEGYVNLTEWIGQEVERQIPDGAFYVTCAEGVMDKSFAELEAAYDKGQALCCIYEEMTLWLQRFLRGAFFGFYGVRDRDAFTVTFSSGGHVDVTCIRLADEENVPTAEVAGNLDSHKALKPSFAWIDDDGKEKVGHLFTWAKTNNVPFTCALISGYIGKSGYLSESQLAQLWDSGLVGFASHTQNHVKLSDADRETVEAEIKNSKEQIEGYGLPCDVMVYPGGAISDGDVDIVRKFFPFGFLAGGNYNADKIPNSDRVNGCPVSTYKLRRVDIRGDYTEDNGGIAYVKGQIDKAIAENGLVVFMSHVGSTDDGAGGYLEPGMDLAVYTEIVAYIRERGYDIEPLMTACQRFANPVEVGDFTVGADGKMDAAAGNMHIVVADNTYTSATTPSGYPANQITTCRVSGDSGMPYSAAGILTAYVVGANAYRTYMPFTKNALYLQIKNNSTDAWLDWSECNQKDFTRLGNNKILSGTLPSALPAGVSLAVLSTAAEIAQMPEGAVGYITAYHLFSSADKAREEWQPNGSINKYVRYATSTNAWSDWYVFTPTPYVPV